MKVDLDAVVRLLSTGHAFGVELGMDERLVPTALGSPDHAKVPRGMTLRRYRDILEVTALHGVVVVLQLTIFDPVDFPSLEVVAGALRDLGVRVTVEWEIMDPTAEEEERIGRLHTDLQSSMVVDGPRVAVCARM